MALDLTEGELAELVFEAVDMRTKAALDLVREALKKRDATLAKLTARVAALEAEQRRQASDQRKRAALMEESEVRARTRRTAEAAERRLAGVAR